MHEHDLLKLQQTQEAGSIFINEIKNILWRDFQFGAAVYCMYSKYKAWYYESWLDNPMMKEHFIQKMPQSFWIAAIKVTYNINFGKSFRKAKKGLSDTIKDNSVVKAQ